jgi:zinc protease
VQDFFRTYYAPNNVTLTLAGDFDTAQAKQLIQEYFGSIPRSPQQAPEVQCTEPFTHLPARDTIRDPNATLPAFQAVYGTVEHPTPTPTPWSSWAPSWAAARARASSSGWCAPRRRRRAPTSARCRGAAPGLFSVFAVANQGVAADRLEKLTDEEIARVRASGVTAAELQRAKNQVRSQSVRGCSRRSGGPRR